MPIDAIVAGAGIWGCTVARRLADVGRKVLAQEKRSVVNSSMGAGSMSGKLLWQLCLTMLSPRTECRRGECKVSYTVIFLL